MNEVMHDTINTVVAVALQFNPEEMEDESVNDSMPTEKAEFSFWGNRHFLSTNRPTLK